MKSLIISSFLLIIGQVYFERNYENGAIKFDGPNAIIVIISIIGIVIAFKIFNQIHEYLYSQGKIKKKLNFKYDKLITVAIATSFIGYSSFGDHMEASDKYSYIFKTGSVAHGDSAPFLLAVIGLVFLIRILALTKALNHKE